MGFVKSPSWHAYKAVRIRETDKNVRKLWVLGLKSFRLEFSVGAESFINAFYG
jgi:hypothetical protein